MLRASLSLFLLFFSFPSFAAGFRPPGDEPLRRAVIDSLNHLANLKPYTEEEERADKGSGRANPPKFIRKLKAMVDDPMATSICWSKDGRTLIIKDTDTFSSELVSIGEFKSSLMKSFIRQLHFYNFKKNGETDSEALMYYNENFDRTGKNLHLIVRKTTRERDLDELRREVDSTTRRLAKTQKGLESFAREMLQYLQAGGQLPPS